MTECLSGCIIWNNKNMSPFERSLRLASSKILVDVNLQCYKIALELFTSVVNKTPSPANAAPHAKGLLANQWYPSIGSGASTERGSSTSASGSSSLSRISALMNGLAFYEKDGRFTLSNNMDYAVLAETTGWTPPRWRGTAPYRMVALSLQATAAKYKKVSM